MTKMQKVHVCAVALIAALLTPAGTAVAAEAMSAQAVVNKASETAYYKADNGRAQVAMSIKDAQGRERKRLFTILRRDDDDARDGSGGQKYYVYFTRPADVNKMVFMVWKQTDKDDDRWLYLPALDLVKRIAASDERTSFVGSHFYYEDVSGRGVEEDEHALIETSDTYYVIKSTPKDTALVEFSSFTTWIHKETFLPIKTEYHDGGGRVYRIYEALGVETIQGYPTVTKARMKDLNLGGETTLTYDKVTYDIGLPEEVFTERYLRNAPRKHLR